MSAQGEVLVAILNNLGDFDMAREQHWYRIPIASVEKWLKHRWPPRQLAFYQTKVFGDGAYAINYYAQVHEIREVYRWQLFPERPRDEKSQKRYYKVILGPLRRLSRPIHSRRRRRIIFIPTTWRKFAEAAELNDLYDESDLEDLLWAQLKRLDISAERQELVQVKERTYVLDFAIYCAAGRLDVETDGDAWHANPQRAAHDMLRDNDLETAGWRVFRFNGRQVREEMSDYCLPTIAENVNRLGGLDEGAFVPRRVHLHRSGVARQLELFDKGPRLTQMAAETGQR